MAFYSFITNAFKKEKKVQTRRQESKQLSLKDMMDELGVRTSGAIGSYEDEEKPDKLTIDNYIQMQDNDGTVRAITRLFSLPYG